ncbi:MAG: hypothetical protein ACK6D3_16950 [Planctomycetaceae bacterium]
MQTHLAWSVNPCNCAPLCQETIVRIAAFFCTLGLLAANAVGCQTHTALREHTLKTSGTLAELNCQQVVDNLARFAAQPASLPSVAVLQSGNVTLADQHAAAAAGTYAPTITLADQLGGFPIFSLFLSPNVSRNLTEQWDLKPVTDTARIRRIRAAFQIVLGAGVSADDPCEDCSQTVRELTADGSMLECQLPTGWFQIGCRRDVPDSACYVGNCGDTYVWVGPEGMDGLSRFTLTIMQLSTSDPKPETRTVVRRYDADDKLESTEITETEPVLEGTSWEADADEAETSEPRDDAARQQPTINPRRTALTPKQARKRKGTSGLMLPHAE